MSSNTIGIYATLLAMLAATVLTLIGFGFVWMRRQVKPKEGEILALEQRKDELERQRNELEKQQQMLIWQMEAAALAQEDPRLAIVTAYQGLEGELQRNLQYSYEALEGLDKQKMRTFYNVDLLKQVIGMEGAEDLGKMREIRNRVVHGDIDQEDVSSDRAIEYVQRAIFLARIISSPAP